MTLMAPLNPSLKLNPRRLIVLRNNEDHPYCKALSQFVSKHTEQSTEDVL